MLGITLHVPTWDRLSRGNFCRKGGVQLHTFKPGDRCPMTGDWWIYGGDYRAPIRTRYKRRLWAGKVFPPTPGPDEWFMTD